MARDFDGTGKITYASAPAALKPTNDFSIFCWANMDNNGDFNHELMSMGDCYAFRMQKDGTKVNCFKHISGSWIEATNTSTSVSRGAWHSYCAVFSSTGTGITFYLDGTSTATNANTSNLVYDQGTGFLIGAHGNGGTTRDADGRICEVAVFDKKLSAGEIAALNSGFSPLFFASSLLFYAPLIGRNSPEPDLINGITGTLTNTANADHPRIIYPSSSQMRKFKSAAGVSTSVKDLIGGGFIPYSR